MIDLDFELPTDNEEYKFNDSSASDEVGGFAGHTALEYAEGGTLYLSALHWVDLKNMKVSKMDVDVYVSSRSRHGVFIAQACVPPYHIILHRI